VAGVEEPASEFAGRMEVISGEEGADGTDVAAVDAEDSDAVELLEEEREEREDLGEIAEETGVRKRDEVPDDCLVEGRMGVPVR
jgi:hypothetical protein